jgi:AcrR family transcriptional regulator
MSAVRQSKEEVLAQFRRTELLAAARRVFGQHGFEQATMDAIADEAKVSKGTIYLYYPSKQAIYDATFREGMAELERLTDARVEAAATARDAIFAFVDVRVRYFQEHPDYFRIYVEEVARQLAHRGPRRSPCRTAIDGQTASLERVFQRALAAGGVRAVDPASAAQAVFDITRGLTGRRVLTGGQSDMAGDIAFITDLIWSGLEPEGQQA